MRVRSAAVAALLLVSAFVVPAAAADDTAPPRADIDLEALADAFPLTIDLDVDEPRHVLGGDGEVFVTADDELLVLDLDGDLVGHVEDLLGAGPMALSPDGEFLFVGLQDSLEVVLFDVEDLEELWAWDLPAPPMSLLATDDHLHVGVEKSPDANGQLITILAEEGSEPLTRARNLRPLLARDDRGLIVGHAGTSPGSVSRRTFEAEALEPPLARTVGGMLYDVQVDPVTDTVWIAGSGQDGPKYSVHALDPATLATTRSIPIGAYPTAVAPLGDGRHVAAGRSHTLTGEYDVSIHRLDDAGTALVAGYDLPERLVHQGLAVTTDGTLAVLEESRRNRAGGWLTLLADPHLQRPELLVDTAAPLAGRAVAVTGSLRQIDGTAIAGADVSVIGPGGAQVHTTTDTDGAFRATLPAAALGVHVEVVVVVPGDPARHPVVVEHTFTPRRSATHIHLEDRALVAGQATPVRGRVTDELGAGRPDVTVTLSRNAVGLGTATTDTDGWFSHPVEFATQGTVTITAAVAQDSTNSARTTSKALQVVRDTQDILIDPATGTARTTMTLTGQVRDGSSRPVVDREVLVTVIDGHGHTEASRATADADGRWTATFTPQIGGKHTVSVTAQQDARYAAGEATRTLTVDRAPTKTTLEPLPTPVDHGAKITLTGQVTHPPGAMLDLVAVDLASGKERRLTRDRVDSKGRVSVEVTARANTRYEARFRGDATHAPSSAKRTVKVRATVTAKVTGHDRTVDGVPSFAKATRPTLTGRVRSADPTGRVDVQLQQRRDGAWVTTAQWRARPDADGRISTRVPNRLNPGRYRARISTTETPANLVGRAPWVELRVRT